jgi:peptidoglycan/xylan/chitin deacetylase (PgdA/CDA1 family)
MTPFMLRELDSGRVRSFDNTRVIDELDALHVPATFFLSGLWMLRYPAETRRLASDPLFELGSHSYAHRAFHLPCYGLGGLLPGAMAADVQHSEQVLRRFDAAPTRFFRFPGGCYDRRALAEIAATGVIPVQYDVVSGDAFGSSVPAIVQQTLSRVRAGSIVVMHVTGGNTAPLTASALPAIVRGLRARGLQLVRLSTLLGYR